MVSIAISFLIMIISVAVSSGFREELRDGISDLTGDVQLLPADMNYINDTSPMSSSPDFLDEIEAGPESSRMVRISTVCCLRASPSRKETPTPSSSLSGSLPGLGT